MLKAEELDAAIHELWYQHLNLAQPGKGDLYRDRKARIPTSRHDLVEYYKGKVLSKHGRFG